MIKVSSSNPFSKINRVTEHGETVLKFLRGSVTAKCGTVNHMRFQMTFKRRNWIFDFYDEEPLYDFILKLVNRTSANFIGTLIYKLERLQEKMREDEDGN